MGTYVSITVFSNEYTGNKAINTAFDRIKEIEDIASIFDETSEASFLNKNGYLDNPSPEFLDLINASLYYYNISGGCFDITVQPLLDLWSGGLWQESEEVQAQRIEEALAVVGSDKIVVSDDSIEFEIDGMAITLGAIAKGYAVDEAMEVLKEFGIKQALINAGGDLYAMGTKPDGTSWTVELENPDDLDNVDTDIEPLIHQGPTFNNSLVNRFRSCHIVNYGSYIHWKTTNRNTPSGYGPNQCFFCSHRVTGF
ncbi:unnamed protein product [marine sediment metagenome]|uniref:FAD:protein FMN transferase n=1 Tax=marine sediment metagenome TaxID=412755 RepID=X1GH89_9ZZZZ